MKLPEGVIRQAMARIRPYNVKKTPLIRAPSHFLNNSGLSNVFFKCENWQTTGVFKYRGAVNAISQLPGNISKIITHSSGNHALALAKAARVFGLESHAVIPVQSAPIQKAMITGYGGQIISCDHSNVHSREEKMIEVLDKMEWPDTCHFIHSSNDIHVVHGQGTMALEIFDEWALNSPPDAILAPLGGGGMLSGIALAVEEWKKELALATTDPPIVIGCEPIHANYGAESKRTGERVLAPSTEEDRDTFLDGLKPHLETLTFPIICSDLVDSIFTVEDDEIVRAMADVYMRLKIVLEPSACVGPAVLANEAFRKYARGRNLQNIAIVLSGGNVDLPRLGNLFQ